MITFEQEGSQVVLAYVSGFGSADWVNQKLKTDGCVTLSRAFTVRERDLLSGDEGDDDLDGELRRFVIGSVDGNYRVIRKDVLGLKHDLLIATSVNLGRKIFVAERDISVFRRIDELTGDQIVVGGDRMGAIPEDEFSRLVEEFPTSTEMTLYARTRVTRVLREYLESMSDAEQRLADYMERRKRARVEDRVQAVGRIPAANELELQKFTYVRDRLVEMLKEAKGYSEAEWQMAVADVFLLVFPQYVAVLHNVHVKEGYTNETKLTSRYIDLVLVGANGCADIIEIKKPFERGLVTKGKYRDNHVPVRELSGSIMQAEKYLFYLSKSGRYGEKRITAKYKADLPSGFEVKIANPKAIILTGRDTDLSEQEKFDFEFVRREFSNVVDIISYDDLLRRLESVIANLTKRATTETHVEAKDETAGSS